MLFRDAQVPDAAGSDGFHPNMVYFSRPEGAESYRLDCVLEWRIVGGVVAWKYTSEDGEEKFSVMIWTVMMIARIRVCN